MVREQLVTLETVLLGVLAVVVLVEQVERIQMVVLLKEHLLFFRIQIIHMVLPIIPTPKIFTSLVVEEEHNIIHQLLAEIQEEVELVPHLDLVGMV